MLLELPSYSSTYQRLFSENKNKYHKIYATRVSFEKPIFSFEASHLIIEDWVMHHRYAFNSVWLQPEFCPSSRRVHYHGFVDIKDFRAFNRFLNRFKGIGSFHVETIKSTPQEYLTYCSKEVGTTEAMEHNYRNFIDATERKRAESAPEQELVK